MGRSGLLASEEIRRGWGGVALLGVPVLSHRPQPVNTGVPSVVPMPGPAPALETQRQNVLALSSGRPRVWPDAAGAPGSPPVGTAQEASRRT